MTIPREDEMIYMPKTDKNSFSSAEFFDVERFSIPAEIYISEKEIAW